MCERLLNLQEIYVSGQNICIEVYGNSVGTITPRTEPYIEATQNRVQRGFTKSSSPRNCSLILEVYRP